MSPARRAVARQLTQRALDDHQRIADLVRDDRRHAAERRQPLALRRLALKARDRVGQRVEGRRQQPRVFVLPAARVGELELARQVAGDRDLTHVVGDRRRAAA